MDDAIQDNIRKERLAKSRGIETIDDEFRDSIATVDEEGKRIWLYPKKPSGKFHNWRIAVTIVLLTILFGGPFVKIGGQPLLLLNVFERKFIVFGQAFWPQDFFLLAIILLTFFVFIILFTVVFGRVWCGWMCPQTLFMEMVFRKIEYWIEGDAPAQRRLSKESWTFNKIWRKTAKHVLFLAISILISHTVMAYLIGIEETFSIVTYSPTENWAGFTGLIGFTAIFYGVYAKFREQACIAVCPYGRLQGVLLTKESIVVAYDWLRGEPRGHLKKNAPIPADQGDCIDCHLCVHVCPTGIDIRNGTQMECVNCTACIDACDDVMVKVGKPKGLIRYASHHSITDRITKIFTARVLGYSVVLLLLLVGLTAAIVTRSDVETTMLKVPGTLYQSEGDLITNLYNIEFVNKTFEDIHLEVKPESPEGTIFVKADGKPIVVPAEGILKTVVFLKIPEANLIDEGIIVRLGVYQNGKKIETVKTRFIGPIKIGLIK